MASHYWFQLSFPDDKCWSFVFVWETPIQTVLPSLSWVTWGSAIELLGFRALYSYLSLAGWVVCKYFLFCRLRLSGFLRPAEAFTMCYILICLLLLLFPVLLAWPAPHPPASPLLCPRSSFLFHHPEDFLLEVSQFGWSNTEERGSALSWQWLTRILFCGHGPLWCRVSCV